MPGPAGPGEGYAVTPKGYGIKAFTLGSAGRVRPVAIENADGVNLTAYGVEGTGWDYVTIINKTQGRGGRGRGRDDRRARARGGRERGPGQGAGAQVMTLAGRGARRCHGGPCHARRRRDHRRRPLGRHLERPARRSRDAGSA